MRRPFVSVMSIRASLAFREGQSSGSGRALSITSGTKPPPAFRAPSVPLRYSRRQIESSDRGPHRRLTAQEQETGLIDLYPHWLALPRAERRLAADGLHPAAGVATRVIAPVLTGYLAAALGRLCP